MRTKRIMALVCAVLLLCTVACAPRTQGQAARDSMTAAKAITLLEQALDTLFLYQGELKTVDKSAPYQVEGRKYYPVADYSSVAQLRQHSRTIFTESFCANVLDEWTSNPQKPRFLERDGKLWESKQVGGMGWIRMLVPNTVEIVEQDDSRCVASAYSQVLTGEVIRTDFLLQKETDGWRLDSYYEFNLTLPVVQHTTVADYLGELAGGSTELLRVTLSPQGGTPVQVDEAMIPPFGAVLGALEYDPDSLTKVEEIPVPTAADDNTDLELVIYSGSCAVSGFQNGQVYVTAPNGTITRLQLLYPGGLVLVNDLINAAKWKLKALQ